VHYCVANMPGAVARTSTEALNNATLPFVIELANKGYKNALLENENLRNGLNVCHGKVTCEAVSTALNIPYHEAVQTLNAIDKVVDHAK
jgi:alanine dehydrogenase